MRGSCSPNNASERSSSVDGRWDAGLLPVSERERGESVEGLRLEERVWAVVAMCLVSVEASLSSDDCSTS